VLRQLGLHRHFAQHIAIESMRVHGQLRPKPAPQLLRKLLARERTAASRCILVEDTLGTLKAAKVLGLRTVWVTRYLAAQQAREQRVTSAPLALRAPCPAYVDVKIKSVRKLSGNLHRLR
jgi:putative hydrolase of the HAD superfamily